MSNILSDAIQRYVMNTPTVQSKAQGTGELSKLGQDPFDLQTFRYPHEGLGDNDVPHYILFNINVPETSKYATQDPSQVTDDQSASTQDFEYLKNVNLVTDNPAIGNRNVITAVTTVKGFVESGTPTGAVLAGGTGFIGATALEHSLTIKPQLKRLKKSIALYLPDTSLQMQYDHDWNTKSLTEAMGLAGVASAFSGDIKPLMDWDHPIESIEHGWDEVKSFFNGNKYNQTGQGAERAGAVAQMSGVAGEGIKELIMRSAGKAINPQLQMVFRATGNREFMFEFDFQARSQAEAADIQNIIKTFKVFAAPELADSGQGRYFVPPAQFDIKFYFKGQENPMIAKISTCALTKIVVDYNKSPPFASFNDGMPVHISLQLIFREMDIIVRELIERFGY